MTPPRESHPLDLRGVSGQACGQGTGAVPVVVKPANLLAQHGLEAEAAQPAGKQLTGLGEGITLEARNRDSLASVLILA